MPDWRVLAGIACIGLTSYALRAGGFLVAGVLPVEGPVQRFLRLAPANLFVAFAAGWLEGGRPIVAGSAVALAAMILTRRLWAALLAAFLVSAGVAFVGG